MPPDAAVPAWAPALGALLLAAVHVATPGLRFLGGAPRSVWLSLAGGVSVAYVFVHLLPELAEGQRTLGEALGTDRASGPVAFAERHVYLVAMVGLATFYGLDKLAVVSRGHPATRDDEAATGPGVFWVHMGSFGLYNALVAYLLVRGERGGPRALALFTVAMALHFVVTDHGLAAHHKAPYRRVGRWVLVAALAAGLALGHAAALPAPAIALLVAFLAGGVMLNVLKEEVPTERRSRFWAFGVGMAAYAALLLLAP